MKILVTGAKGQLGFDVLKQLDLLGLEAVGVDLPELDITDYSAVEECFEKVKPDAVIHCAAFTNVDLAETEREICGKVNADGTLNIARCAKEYDAKLMYISTDYVFDGKGDIPFEVDSPKAPCNYYGESKLAGENVVINGCSKYFIVRISWVFGVNGKNFVKTMLRLSEDREKLTVVNDQIGSPTYTPDLAKLLCEMIQTEKYGVYHATNEGFCSWAEFAKEIMNVSGASTEIIPITSAEYKASVA
ncbi:MAG: dTDP-4-dehydrorhamnose reductase, partial [Clostridia bacterium]|nr:dTDP-4-dehydrorhamnose reductase [Clostridia bacterium]